MADKDHPPPSHSLGGGWVLLIVALVVALVVALLCIGSFILYTHYRARRLGLPPPPLNPFTRRSARTAPNANYTAPTAAPGGVRAWLGKQVARVRHARTAGGAYEATSHGGRGRRGFGPLDPDEAWDARVGGEAEYAYGGEYEEQELGALQDGGNGPYGGGGYGDGGVGVGVGGIPAERGRSRSRQREVDARYEEALHGPRADPFGDGAEPSSMSLRGVSPRPLEGEAGRAQRGGKQALGVAGEGETERRSMFREDV